MALSPSTRKAAWRRAVASVVVVTFTAGTLQPLSVVGKEPEQIRLQIAQAVEREATRSPLQARRLGTDSATQASGASLVAERLSQLHEHLKELAPEASRDERVLSPKQLERARRADDLIRPNGTKRGQKIAAVKQLMNEVRAGRRAMRASLDAVEVELLKRSASGEVLVRQRQAVEAFESRADEFEALADRLSKATSTAEQAALDELARFFRRHPAARPHAGIDPENLPWGAARSVTRPPAETIAQLKHEVFGAPVQLASGGSLRTLGLNASAILAAQTSVGSTPTLADLAESDDVQLTAAIRAKARELDNNPVQISNWVRNSIEWIPSWGSIQGAETTLLSGRGNAIDTASLTIALLRAAGIHARYVVGTIEVDAARLTNWAGGVDKVEAAISLMGQGGIATTALISGGTIVKVRMQHAWVQAYVNWVPSRGARNFSPTQHHNANANLNSWVDIDTSYKQYEFSGGMNLAAAVPFDANAFLASATQGATIDAASGYVKDLAAASAQSQLTAYRTLVQGHIEAIKPGATVGDVLGTRAIAQERPSVLAGSLPYATRLSSGLNAGNVVRTEAAILTDSLKWTVDLKLYASAYDRALDNALFSRSLPLAAIGGRRIGLTYEPATAADRQVLETAADQYQTKFAAYLVNVTPRLRLQDVLLAEAPAVAPGVEHELGVSLRGPGDDIERTYRITAGSASALVINPNGMTPEYWQALLAAKNLTQSLKRRTDPYRLAEEALHEIGAAWWATKWAYEDLIGSQQAILRFNMPSHALIKAPLTVEYFFGIPRSASFKTRSIDAKLDLMAVEHKRGDSGKRREFLRTVGAVGSYLEGAVFELAFLAEQPYGVSTISLLGAANSQGARIYHFEAGSVERINLIATSAEVRRDLANALGAGLRATVPERDVTHFAYTGIGYIVEDPEIGAAAYLIDGGANGGGAPTGEAVYPLPALPAGGAMGLIVSAALRGSGFGIAASSGTIAGLTVPALLGTCLASIVCGGAVILAALVPALVIFSSHSASIEARYPRTSRIFRHYTRSGTAPLISASKLLLGSQPGGTLNPDFRAVYVEEPVDPRISCPPSAEQSAQKARDFQLPLWDGEAPEGRADAYVEVEVTRAGYWEPFILKGLNSLQVEETVFALPFVYFGPFAVAIRQHGDPCYHE